MGRSPHDEDPSDAPPFPDSYPETGALFGPPPGALATSHVGNYTLYSTIGEGAFGKVKIAVHRGSNVRVAIKIMDKGEIRAQDFTAQVRREIYIMRRLKHPHIVRMHEVLTSDTKLYIVMELVTGGELFHRIENGRVKEHVARQYFQQLVDGVDFCHKKGVAHRDLKPENLLVDENGDIKITDFGFSSMKGMDVNTGLLYTQCGTPDYCAPEIIDSAQNGYTGAKVDAWSCGIILFALLCGRLPFQEQDTNKLYDLILACDVKYPNVISHSARDLLRNLLIRDPHKRFDLQKVKRHPWFLVNYEGDDARLIKKRPFFNKNQKDLSGSGPPSPMASTHSDQAPSASLPTTSFPLPPHPPASSSNQTPHSHPSPMSRSQATANGRHHSNSPSRNIPPMPRMREESQNSYIPSSPAAAVDAHIRTPTPPVHDIFTPVQDRPATPAARQNLPSTPTAFKPSVLTTNSHVRDTAPVFNGVPISQGSSLGSEPVQAPALSTPRRSPPTFPKAGLIGSRDGVKAKVDDNDETNNETNDDDTSSEPDSTEDYIEKPAPLLEMPPDPRQLLRMTKDGRRQIQSLPNRKGLRHRSDLIGANNVGATTSPSPVTALEHGSASMSAIQRPRRVYSRDGYSRDGPSSGTINDARSLRIATRPPEVPSSPPVVYSPSSATIPSLDRFRAMSPGYNAVRSGVPAETNQNGSYPPTSGGVQPPTWQQPNSSNSVPGYSSREEQLLSSLPSMTFQTEILLRHHWSMLCKWRGSADPVNPRLMHDLRQDVKLSLKEMKQISRIEDKANMFTNFLYMFEHLALTDGHTSPSGFGRHSGEEEYENGSEIRDDPHSMSNGDGRSEHMRLAPTDISSEEALSWSPVVADACPQSSDLARRRDLSDLLNKWINRSNECSGEGEEIPPYVDVYEMQRLVREHHGGREESNLADELLRLMSPSDDGAGAPFSTISSLPGQSPPPPHVQTTRSADSYTAASRYQGNGFSNNTTGRPNPIRSVSSNNTPLPSEYVPGRFREPNSMPARGRNGNDRQTGLSGRGEGRGDLNDVGNTIGGNGRNLENMATSMGMHNVAYYSSDKKSGMANRLRGVLQTMKAKNQRLGEHHAQFKSSLPPDVIMRLLGRVLQDMGAIVTIKKETKRKMKCHLTMSNWTLYAGIELIGTEDGLTCVSFRRSKADKGKTDTDSFHNFFEGVLKKFIREANIQYPSDVLGTSGSSPRRRDNDGTGRNMSDSIGQSTAS